MSQQNKSFLFFAVCCYIIQVILCVGERTEPSSSLGDGNTSVLPRSSFSALPKVPTNRPNFFLRRQSLLNLGSENTSNNASQQPPINLISDLPVARLSRSYSRLGSASDDKQNLVKLATPRAPQALALNATSKEEKLQMKPELEQSNRLGSNSKEESSSEEQVDRISKENPEEDPYYIADRESLKEQAKELIRNLLRNENANRAVTHIVRDGKELLKSKVFSQIVKTHAGLIKNTLTNAEARKIFEKVEARIARVFNHEKASTITTSASASSLKYLSDANRPKEYEEHFKLLSNLVNSRKVRNVAEVVKDGFISFVESGNSSDKIAKLFDGVEFLLYTNFTNLWNLVKGGK